MTIWIFIFFDFLNQPDAYYDNDYYNYFLMAINIYRISTLR